MLEFWQAFPAWMTPLANTNVVVDYIAVCENVFYSSVMMGKAGVACALRRKKGKRYLLSQSCFVSPHIFSPFSRAAHSTDSQRI